MTRRLDVSALVSLVGRDRLRAELDQEDWFLLEMLDNIPTVFRRVTISSDINPIEWLIYNDLWFALQLMDRYLLEEPSVASKVVKIVTGDRYEPESSIWLDRAVNQAIPLLRRQKELPIEVADILWNTMSGLSVNYILYQLLRSGDWSSIVLRRADGTDPFDDKKELLIEQIVLDQK